MVNNPLLGLFSGAISMSGNALCPWANVPNPKIVSKRLASSVGCPTKKPKYLVACLMNKEAKEIVEAQQELAVSSLNSAITIIVFFSNYLIILIRAGTTIQSCHSHRQWKNMGSRAMKFFCPRHQRSCLRQGTLIRCHG